MFKSLIFTSKAFLVIIGPPGEVFSDFFGVKAGCTAVIMISHRHRHGRRLISSCCTSNGGYNWAVKSVEFGRELAGGVTEGGELERH